MSKKCQSIKGFYDVLPNKTPLWHFVEDKIREVLNLYAYEKINLPIVEPTSLFIDSVGTHTDIVEKEMYSWVDPLNEDQLTLRPEGTAGCVRAVIEHNLTYNGPIRLWYQGPMFRHENVQKGRQRQFNQVGVEAFGFNDANIDAFCIHPSAEKPQQENAHYPSGENGIDRENDAQHSLIASTQVNRCNAHGK